MSIYIVDFVVVFIDFVDRCGQHPIKNLDATQAPQVQQGVYLLRWPVVDEVNY
jgi:hypothetical protein